jgi:hypothetical protein
MSRSNRLVPRTDIYQSQNRRFPYDPSPKNLTIPRRLTTIVIKDETTFTETYKKGEHVSAVLDFHCVGVRVGWTFLCVGVCVGGGVATSSLFVCLLPNSFRSHSKPSVLASLPVTCLLRISGKVLHFPYTTDRSRDSGKVLDFPISLGIGKIGLQVGKVIFTRILHLIT